MTRLRRTDVWISVLIFLFNVALTYPLFLPGDTPYRDSIEGGYAGMAKFIDAHPSPWGWNRLQYCGLPTQFLYVPALLYAVWILPGDPVYGYKVLTASLACLGPVTLYLAFAFFTGSRLWAVITAIGYTLCSPTYGLIPQADKDRGLTYLPWRLHVYAKYGEGPHNAGLTLMPLAWIASWHAATRGQFRYIFILAVLMATITLTNWIAGFALAITTVLLVLAGHSKAPFKSSRILLAGALAYGMACFWLTPTFIRTIAFNWPTDAFNYRLQSSQYQLMGWYLACLIGLALLLKWLQWPFWERFISLAVLAFGYPVMMHYGFGVDMIPESRRYAIEFELFFVTALGAFMRFTASSKNRVRHVCASIAVLAFVIGGVAQVRQYLVQPRTTLLPLTIEQTPEYKAGRWIADQKPRGRVLVSGGLRFRLNSWFDIAQAGGTFESGLRNRTPVHFAYHVRTAGPDGVQDAIRELKALGIEYLVIHGPTSAEHYRDYNNPKKFEGILERAYGDETDTIYRVPFSGLAHAVYSAEEPERAFRDALGKYIQAIDDPARSKLKTTWLTQNRLRIEGSVPKGMHVSLRLSYDPGWQASSNGRDVTVEKDRLGFIRIRSAGPIDLEYVGTLEQKVFGFLSAAVWIGAVGLLCKNRT